MKDKEIIRAWVKRREELLRAACKHNEANEMVGLLSYIDSMQEEQVKESPVSKHEDKTCKENGNSLTQKTASKIIFDGNFNKSWYAHPELAFKAGVQKMREQMMANAVDVTVHIDAGNYPYIPQMELYDYDKDIPLAREGDKYKVVLIKGE